MSYYETQMELGQDCLLCGLCESSIQILAESHEELVVNFCRLFRIDGQHVEVANTIRDSFYCLSCRSELQLVSELYNAIDETVVKLRGIGLQWETKLRSCIDDIDSAFPDQEHEEDYDMHFREISKRKQLLICMKLQHDYMEGEKALPFPCQRNQNYMRDVETQTEILHDSLPSLQKQSELHNTVSSPFSSSLEPDNTESENILSLQFLSSGPNNYLHSNASFNISDFNHDNETPSDVESVLEEKPLVVELGMEGGIKEFEEENLELLEGHHVRKTGVSWDTDGEYQIKSKMKEWKTQFKLKEVLISLPRIDYDLPVDIQGVNYPFCCNHGCGKCLIFANYTMDQNFHMDLTPFECPYPGCTKKFRTVENLRAHRGNHKDITQRKIPTRKRHKNRSQIVKTYVGKCKSHINEDVNTRKGRKLHGLSSNLLHSIVRKISTQSNAIKARYQWKNRIANLQKDPLSADDIVLFAARNEVDADNEDDYGYNDDDGFESPDLGSDGIKNDLGLQKKQMRKSLALTCLIQPKPVSKKSEGSVLEVTPTSQKLPSPVSPEPEINTSEDIISLIEWLKLEKQKSALDLVSNPTGSESNNIILLEPDPTLAPNDSLVINSENPVMCRLCRAKIDSVWKVRNHAENCWLHNKVQHVYCVRCDKPLNSQDSIRHHNNLVHANKAAALAQCATKTTDIDKNRGGKILDKESIALPLDQWLRIEKAKPNNVILLEPDPSYEKHENVSFEVSEASPIKCKLCQRLLVSEMLVKYHVQMCWKSNKAKHVYCIPCDRVFTLARTYHRHNVGGRHTIILNDKIADKSVFTCRRCLLEFSNQSEIKYHEKSFQIFRKNMLMLAPKHITNVARPEHVLDSESDTNLSEWLKFQRTIVFSDGSENVILLDPEPKEGENTKINEDNPIACQLCMKKFVNLTTLKSHVVACWSHEEKNHRYCLKCKKLFPNPKELQDHKNKSDEHSKEQGISVYKCRICRKEFEDEKTLVKHKESHYHSDGSLKFFVCQVCDKAFLDRNYFYRHMNRYSTCKLYKCPNCPYATRTKVLIKKHKIKHKRVTDCLCKICGKSFPSSQKLRGHQSSHSKKRLVRKSSYSKKLVDRKSTCSDRTFQCTVEDCNVTFNNRASLNYHKQIKHFKELGLQSEFLCSTCGIMLKTKSHLYRHVHRRHPFIKHGTDKPFKCTYEGCSRVFSLKQVMTEHLRIHTGEKPFQCDKCGKAFHFSGSFFGHKKKCHGTFRLSCPKCPMMFEKRWDLKRHLKRHDVMKLTDKPFKCTYEGCSRAFSLKYGMTEHLRTHTGEKPFQCGKCGKAYHFSGSFFTHKKNCHGTFRQISCPKCPMMFERRWDLKCHLKRHEEGNDIW